MKSDHDSDATYFTGAGYRRFPSRREKEREFPPPISQTENLTRYYTGDGRLIIREEKANYLRASRSNGRLTIQLVGTNEGILDRKKCDSDDVEGREVDAEIEREKREVLNNGVFDDVEEIEGDVEGECKKGEVVNDAVLDEPEESKYNVEGECDDSAMDGCDLRSGVDRTGVIGGGKCYRYNSCLGGFGMGVPAIRPVHT
ncbi:hypothetical protein LguiB_017576 [Lonicera macranthoides]